MQDFHLHYRYSYRHSHLHTLQHSFRYAFDAACNARLPIQKLETRDSKLERAPSFDQPAEHSADFDVAFVQRLVLLGLQIAEVHRVLEPDARFVA